MSKHTALALIRWVVALTLIAKCALTLVRTADGEGESFAGAMASALLAFAAGITGLLLIVRDLAPWLSAPIWRFVTGIIFPDDQFDRPPVNYALPRSYRERHRPGDAIEEYLKIIHYHPQEHPAYLECIELMIETGDLAGAEELRAKGLKKLRSPEARSQLAGKTALRPDPVHSAAGRPA